MKNFEVNQNELELLLKLVKSYIEELDQFKNESVVDEPSKTGNEVTQRLKALDAAALLEKLENTMNKI